MMDWKICFDFLIFLQRGYDAKALKLRSYVYEEFLLLRFDFGLSSCKK